jgi:SAM-dependent methyltransferase
MTNLWTPEMGIIEFFDKVYSQYERYWQHLPRYEVSPHLWAQLIKAMDAHQLGRVLDLGAGEGTDAIHLARRGYEVDAVEGSAVGADKIVTFARRAGVRVNVIHSDANTFQPQKKYDIVLCNGLLHYIEEKDVLLRKIQRWTNVGGYNMISLFSDHRPVPNCHHIISVYPDKEDGIVAAAYQGWSHSLFLEHDKLDNTHLDFPPHHHSFIKILAQKPEFPVSDTLIDPQL